MLQLKQVTLHNFCQHRDAEFAFMPGVTGIVGGNARGKSNAIKAIKFAAIGESGNVGAKIDDLNWQAAQEGEAGFVTWSFAKDGVDGVLKRFINTSRATLRYGETKCNSASATNAEILKIMGVTRKTVEDIVFVMQGEIERILFERPSDRAKKFQGLFGTESAEKLRDLLQKELAAISTDPVDDRIEELKRHLAEDVDPQLKQFNDEKNKLESVVVTADLDALRDVAARYERAAEIDTKLAELSLTAGRLTEELEQLHGAVDTAEGVIKQLTGEVTTVAEEITSKRAQLQSLQAANKLFSARQSLLADTKSWHDVLASPEPVPPRVSREQVDGGLCQVSESQVEIRGLEGFVAAFEGQTGDPICPTCRQPVHDAAEMVRQYKAELPAKREAISASRQLLGQAQEECRQFEQELGLVRDRRGYAKRRLDVITERLDELGDVSPVDADATEQLKQDIATHDEAATKLDTFHASLNQAREDLASKRSTYDATLEQIAELREELVNRPSMQDAADADQAIHQAEQDQLRLAEIEGHLKQLQTERARTLAELQGLEEQSSDLEAKRKYRDLCDRARTVLHRDNLPHMVTVAYLRALNEQLAQYLRIFGVDFSCYIADDLSVTCYFPGAGEQPAGRLSGGQKVMLGIAFRFAVYNLFASSMGFMVLDEPTNMLDGDNVGHVLEVLVRVGRYAHNVGMQLVIITHEERLLGAFDRTIRL